MGSILNKLKYFKMQKWIKQQECCRIIFRLFWDKKVFLEYSGFTPQIKNIRWCLHCLYKVALDMQNYGLGEENVQK